MLTLGALGIRGKNTFYMGPSSKKSFDFASLFKNGEQGLWLDPSLNIKDGWRVNHVVSTTNPALWLDPLKGTHTINSDGSYTIKLLIESTSGIGLGARSQYPVGTSIDTGKTVYRSVEVKKVDAHIVRFGAAGDAKAVFVDLNTLEVVRNGGQVDARITDLGDGFVRIEIFTYSATALSAVGVSNLIGWGNSRNTATLAETINTSLTLRKPVYAVLDGNVTQAPIYQEIVNADIAFLEAHPNHSMFQDAAGTIPVTGVGQRVGLILDKSGTGKHAYQIDSAKQPILRFNALINKYYLEFDGVDDFLMIRSRVFDINQKCTVLAHIKTLNTDTKALISSGTAGYLRTTTAIFSQYDTVNPPGIRQASQDILEAYFDNSIGTRLKTSIAELQSDLKITSFNGASVFISTFSDTHTALRANIHLYSLLMRSDILDSTTVDKVKKVM